MKHTPYIHQMDEFDSCQWYYECASCHELLKPKREDCCVFCSYGSVKCPPVQARALEVGS